MEIRHGELSVRPLNEGDATHLHKWLNDPRVLEFYEGRDRPHSMAMIQDHYYRPLREVASSGPIRDAGGSAAQPTPDAKPTADPGPAPCGSNHPATTDHPSLAHAAASTGLRCLVSWAGQPVGYIQMYIIDEEEYETYGYPESERVFGLDQFLGEPDKWNQGIGTTLVRVVANWLIDEAGADKVVLDPGADNPRAIHVYEKCGFRKKKLLPKREFHEGTYRDCWLMEFDRSE